MKFQLKASDLVISFDILKRLHRNYVSYFQTKTRTVALQSLHYLQGKFVENGRGNMVRYGQTVPDCNHQSLHHFMSDSPWDEKPIINQLQSDVSRLIGDEMTGSLHLDESCFKKSGKNSVGVKRQYCGRLGKVDTCQVGVYLGYTNGPYRTLIDERLYLPEDWAEDPLRLEQCGVPDHITFQTKAELGLEMVQEAQERGVPSAWMGMDTFYGEQPWLLDAFDEKGMIYIADVPSTTHVWLTRPHTEIPEKKGTKGRNPTREKVLQGEPKPITVTKIAKELDSSEYQRIFLRDTERKELWCEIACLRVYPVRDELPGKEQWLIIRKDEGEQKSKYQLSNASDTTTVERLGQMSCSRYWIERAFQDAKGTAGMADYQMRGWRGWHHHMVMTLLAMLFILMFQIQWEKKVPMLTVFDVKQILEEILPKKELNEIELIKMIKQKHKARLSAAIPVLFTVSTPN